MSPKKKTARTELAELKTERDRTDARTAEIGAERERIAHAALTGDAAAREQLGALKRELAELADHRKDVEGAIAEGMRRIDAETSAAERRQAVAAAERRKAVAASLREAGERADRSAREFAAALTEIEALTRDSDAADIPQLAFVRVRPHMMNAAHSVFLPVQTLFDPSTRRIVPPAARHSFGDVLGGWATAIDAEADGVIAGESSKKKEAA